MRSRASREAPSNSTQLPRKHTPPPKCRQALTDIRGKVKKKNRTIEKVKQQQQSDLCWQELSGLPISGPRLKGCSPETHWPWRPASWDPGSPAGTAPGSPPHRPPPLPAASAIPGRRLNLWPRLIGTAKNSCVLQSQEKSRAL